MADIKRELTDRELLGEFVMGRLEERPASRWAWAVSAAACLVLGLALGLLMGSGGDAPEPQDPAERVLALRDAEQLTPGEVRFLQGALFDRSTRVQRLSLGVLSRNKVRVPSAMLEAMLAQPRGFETVDLPEEFAGPGEVEDARALKHGYTQAAVLSALLHNAKSFGEHPPARRVIPFFGTGDETVRVYVVRILGVNPEFIATADLRSRIQSDSQRVQRAATELLSK